jgi:hypothetical protein
MLQSRRGFLIGRGSLLTTAFVGDERALIRRTGEPLLPSPVQITQTLYWYESGEDNREPSRLADPALGSCLLRLYSPTVN